MIEQGGGDPTPLWNEWIRKTFKETNAVEQPFSDDAFLAAQTPRERVAAHLRKAEGSATALRHALDLAAEVKGDDGAPYLERHGWSRGETDPLIERLTAATRQLERYALRAELAQNLPPLELTAEQLAFSGETEKGGRVTAAVSYVTRLAGDHAGEPYRVSLDTPGADGRLALPRAIYLAYTRERKLHYAGKVDRGNRGTVAQRLREHTRASRRKRTAWRSLWVVPIADTMTASELLQLERAVIRTYHPPGNVQHASAA